MFSMDNLSIILDTDSYKLSHWDQYDPRTTFISSYVESRGYSDLFDKEPEVVHFGLQMELEYLAKPITRDDISTAQYIVESHGYNFNRTGWDYIVDIHGGYLPLKIEALPEGTVIPYGIPQVQLHNTSPTVPWLTTYIEDTILRSVWAGSTVATLSREIKKDIYPLLQGSSDNADEAIKFALHNFSARGVTSKEAAAKLGVAHLTSFLGTDNVLSLPTAMHYYDCGIPGFSIPAAEHSTITSWGKFREQEAYENILDKFAKPGKMVAVVSDSWDIYNALKVIWGENLKQRVIDSGAKVIIRLDSGDPLKITLEAIEILGEKFGYSYNSKGFKVLPNCIRLLQGDGVNKTSIRHILHGYIRNGWSAENIAFGMGGALGQKINRDDLAYAMKVNAISFDNSDWIDVCKAPIGDRSKWSKAGIQYVVHEQGKWFSVKDDDIPKNELIPVFHNGDILKTWNFNEVRENTKL